MPDWRTLAIDATWVSGCVNWREYWMKAWMSPMVMAPDETRRPPTTAMATKLRLPMNVIAGWISPDANCAPKLAWYSSSFLAANRSSTSCCRPKALTSAWPVNVSSTCALSAPVWRHCATKRGCARLAICLMMVSESGTVTMVITARSGEIVIIITTTPTMVSSEVSSWLSVCWRLWATLSMSLVTRLRRSPRGCPST